MAKISKRERITERLNMAVEDVRLNGRQGRTVGEIAKVYRCNKGTLRYRLSQAGLLGGVVGCSVLASEPQEREKTSDSGQSLNLGDSLAIKGLDKFPTNLVGNRGDEGGNPLQGSSGVPSEPKTDEDRLKVVTSEVRRVIESSIRAGAKVLKCETPGDLERLYKLYRETFKSLDGESSGTGRGLIQVQILGDASAPAPRSVRVIEAKSTLISESPSDSVPISPEGQAAQGSE